jgi:RNA polymerase sigma-70 factor, ECF subfamily
MAQPSSTPMTDSRTPEQETAIVARAQAGDPQALESLVEPLRRPLKAYMYRMIVHPDEAEDLYQDTMVRLIESLPKYRRESRFKAWLFGIATHVCLDHLRQRRRWRLEAKLLGEKEALETPGALDEVERILSEPDLVFEIREHISYCFSCLARTLKPEEQAAILLREVLEFTNQEAAAILEVSEPVFRHRLSGARSTLATQYEGLCRLVSKGGACWQCKGLREFAPEANRGADLVQIEVRPGMAVTAESLLDARLDIVRLHEWNEGKTASLHRAFGRSMSLREETRG